MTEDDFAPARRPGQTVPGAPHRTGPAAARQILAFALETALLFAVGYWAISVFPGHAAAAAVTALAGAVLFWGLLLAPRAKNRLAWPALPLVAGGAFLAGAGLLMVSGLTLAALLLAGAAVGNLVWDLASGYPAVAAPVRPAARRSGRRAARR